MLLGLPGPGYLGIPTLVQTIAKCKRQVLASEFDKHTAELINGVFHHTYCSWIQLHHQVFGVRSFVWTNPIKRTRRKNKTNRGEWQSAIQWKNCEFRLKTFLIMTHFPWDRISVKISSWNRCFRSWNALNQCCYTSLFTHKIGKRKSSKQASTRAGYGVKWNLSPFSRVAFW